MPSLLLVTAEPVIERLRVLAVLHDIGNSAKPVPRFGLGWVTGPDGWYSDGDSLGEQQRLYIAAGKQLMTVDVTDLKFAAEDGSYSAGQLCAVTAYRDDLIGHITRDFPHCLNVRELRPEQCSERVHLGDTVLHFASRNVEKNAQLCRWLGVTSEGEEAPKTKPRTFYPIANLDPSDCNDCAAGAAQREGCGRFGATAMHLTIKNSTHGTLVLLCKRLTTFLSPQHAVLLNDAMALLAVALPETVYEVLDECDLRIFQEQELLTQHIRPDTDPKLLGKNASKSVRVEIDRDEVRCSDAFMATKHVPDDDDYEIPPNVDFIAERKHVWGSPPFKSESDEATKEPVRAFACGLAGLLANPSDEVWDATNETGLGLSAPCTNNRTYTLIVENCGSEVYNCRTMKLATQFKWETSVHPMQVKMMRMYIFCTFISTAGMLSCTHAYGYVPRVGDILADGSGVHEAAEYVPSSKHVLPWPCLCCCVALLCCSDNAGTSPVSPAGMVGFPWRTFCLWRL